jgi:hypothetical protein
VQITAFGMVINERVFIALSGQTTTLKINKFLGQLSGRFCLQPILFNDGMRDQRLFKQSLNF